MSLSWCTVPKMRRENDFYPTPDAIVKRLVRHLADRWEPTGDHNEPTIWEPCAGDGRMVDALSQAGFKTVSSDIKAGMDFFKISQPLAEVVVTNPPFSHIRPFITHAFQIGIQQMALVCPERLWASGIGLEGFRNHRPHLWVNLSWREDFLGKGGSPDRALAIAIWDEPCAEKTIFDVWSR